MTDCDLCDVQRTCDCFAQQGAQCDPVAIIDGLWDRYGRTVDPNDLTADMSRLAMTSGDVSDDGIDALTACMLESFEEAKRAVRVPLMPDAAQNTQYAAMLRDRPRKDP